MKIEYETLFYLSMTEIERDKLLPVLMRVVAFVDNILAEFIETLKKSK